MHIVDAVETGALLPFGALIEALRRGFAQGCDVPIRHHHTIKHEDRPDATLLLMPAWHGEARARRFLGVKIVTVFPGNAARGIPGLTSTYMLYDAQTGTQLAILDGNTITVRRTVAASALAADYLARKDAKSLLVVGSGKVASFIADAYREVRPVETVQVWDIEPSQAERLVQRLRQDGFAARLATDLEQAVRDADIISAATLATTPLIRGAWLKPGTHVDLIGGFTPKMREADDAAVAHASIFIDTREAMHEAGDIVQPLTSGLIFEGDVKATLEDLCRQNVMARSSEHEITLYKAVGTALADLTAATMVYESIEQRS